MFPARGGAPHEDEAAWMKPWLTRRPDRPLGADAAAYFGEVGGPLLAEAAAPGCEWFSEGDAKYDEDLRAHELLRRWKGGASQGLGGAGPATWDGEGSVGDEQTPRLRGDEAAACAASEASSGADADVCVPDVWTWSRGSTAASASERADPRAACDPMACPPAKASSASFSSGGADAAEGPGPATAAGGASTRCIIQWVAPAACAQPAGHSASQYSPAPGAPTPGRAATAVGLAGVLAKVAAYVESLMPGSLALLCAFVVAVALAAKAGGDERPEKAARFANAGAEDYSSTDEAASLADLLCPTCLSYGPDAV